MDILETNRLLLREMNDNDLIALASILQDSTVSKVYEHEFSDDDVKDWLERQKQRYQQYGFGLWAIVLKETGQMIGQAGLTMQPFEEEEVLEIGYLLNRQFRGKGFAVEAANACKEYAFNTLQVKKVHSIIKVDNFASIRVAEAIGMKKEKHFFADYYNDNMPHYLYSIKNSK